MAMSACMRSRTSLATPSSTNGSASSAMGWPEVRGQSEKQADRIDRPRGDDYELPSRARLAAQLKDFIEGARRNC